jgi:site-specific DNA recombinase
MTPTHTNKRGARYRYYVSHALLQKRNHEAGSVPRVPAPEIESVVLKALSKHFDADEDREQPTLADERNRIERQLDRVVVQAGVIKIHLAHSSDRGQSAYKNGNLEGATPPRTLLTVPWSGAVFGEVKGILHTPSPSPRLSSETRDALLGAIAKARIWIDELVEGPVSSFAEIAKREGKVERHIRLLAPLAFVSPRLISEIVDGAACPNLTVTSLAKALAYSWAKQRDSRTLGS